MFPACYCNMFCAISNMSTASRSTQKDKDFSSQSIINIIESFVNEVNNMDNTILVPSRLMGLKIKDDDSVMTSKSLKATSRDRICSMAAADLYGLYTVINSVRNKLLWGHSEDEENGLQKLSINSISTVKKGHTRTSSGVSTISTNSIASVSDLDGESGLENDSGTEMEKSLPTLDYCQQTTEDFSWHLNELRHSLEEMTEAAAYLTARYESEVGDM